MNAGSIENPKVWRGRVITAVKLILLVVAVWYVGNALLSAFKKIDDWGSIRFRPLWILLGAGAVAAAIYCIAVVYRLLYRRMGSELAVSQGVVLYAVPLLGTYVPGRVLALAGHAAIALSFGVPLRVSAAVVVLMTGLGLAAAMLLGLAVLFFTAIPGIDATWFRAAAAAGIVVLLALLHPRVFFGAINKALRLLKRKPLEASISCGTMALLLVLTMVHVLLYVGGFMAMVVGLLEIPADSLPALTGIFCVANTIAFLAVFAPGGIGVREGILLFSLEPILGEGKAALVTVALRLIQVVCDAILGAIGIALLHRCRNSHSEPQL